MDKLEGIKGRGENYVNIIILNEILKKFKVLNLLLSLFF